MQADLQKLGSAFLPDENTRRWRHSFLHGSLDINPDRFEIRRLKMMSITPCRKGAIPTTMRTKRYVEINTEVP